MNEYVLKRGEVGSVMTVTLSDADGAVNLTGGTVVLTVRKGTATPVIDEVACVMVTPASGIISYEFDADTANIAKGEYNGEFKYTSAAGAVSFFPKSKDDKRTYFNFLVQNPL
jgi:hypothetical protein